MSMCDTVQYKFVCPSRFTIWLCISITLHIANSSVHHASQYGCVWPSRFTIWICLPITLQNMDFSFHLASQYAFVLSITLHNVILSVHHTSHNGFVCPPCITIWIFLSFIWYNTIYDIILVYLYLLSQIQLHWLNYVTGWCFIACV